MMLECCQLRIRLLNSGTSSESYDSITCIPGVVDIFKHEACCEITLANSSLGQLPVHPKGARSFRTIAALERAIFAICGVTMHFALLCRWQPQLYLYML